MTIAAEQGRGTEAGKPGRRLLVDGVSREFPDGAVALHHVDLVVDAGEVVAVVGPSGCGKTTLLRLAAGLDQPTSGTVERHVGQVGFVFQEPTLLPWRTARANVELPAELTGVDAGVRRARASEALAAVGLAGVEDRMVNALSVGMRMRVSLARALTSAPDLFLFDEPFAAVDELTRHQLNDLCRALQRQSGFAALFVTHSIAEAVYMADRVVVLSPGPGTVVAEVAVPLGERQPSLRFAPAFAEICGQVYAAVSAGR